MSQIKRQYESYPANYYSVDPEPGRIIRAQPAQANYFDAQRFYNTHGPQVLQRRDRNVDQHAEQYEEYSDGYYEEPDHEAQYMFNQVQPEVQYDRQNIPPRNYHTVSPDMYARNSKSQSPYIVQNMAYTHEGNYTDANEPNGRSNKYHR
jgi:hypothetical protein